METIYDIIKANFSDKGEATMWDATKVISDAVEHSMPEDHREHLKREIYALMSGGHFNEMFAKEAVGRMYYTDDDGKDHYAPYWTEQAVREMYDSVAKDIPHYNFWDFFVTLHLVSTRNHKLLVKWFPKEDTDEREDRYVEMAVNWLHDEQSPFGKGTKIWGYMNSGK